MRNSILVLIAAVFLIGSGSSTLEAQLLSRSAIRSGPAPTVAVSPTDTLNPVISDSVGQLPSVAAPMSYTSALPYANSASYRSHTGWYPYVIARPADRDWIRETPIELRPNRPLHFWGNSRRRVWR
ncbi:hypothetical protein [Mariniblastus fucicola]|uniref:Uncharacterized protein n=1 Tax=Mariniblastus fucicola TaxID=980251 RepID=A0A5B9PJ41_9BACT|nr:hypothetical protein [Mariniblastus fucicola]QEG25265.1 hypothetical protein MFFC18_51890 [Mariniblastus fucicola]